MKFPVFATAGLEDFNYLEMVRLDERLTSAHYLAVFDGGHELPPDTGRNRGRGVARAAGDAQRPKGQGSALVESLFASRTERLRAGSDLPARLRLLRATVADFAGLRDTTDLQTAVDALAKDPQLKSARARERSDLEAEARMLDEAVQSEARLRDPSARGAALARLRTLFESWSRAAAASEPSPERARARRLLGAVARGRRRAGNGRRVPSARAAIPATLATLRAPSLWSFRSALLRAPSCSPSCPSCLPSCPSCLSSCPSCLPSCTFVSPASA